MITKEEAYEKVDKHLIENIGNLVGPGEPVFDNKIGVWVVPIFHMSKIVIFPLGEVVVNNGGNILYAPTIKDIEDVFERKLERNEELKEKFQVIV